GAVSPGGPGEVQPQVLAVGVGVLDAGLEDHALGDGRLLRSRGGGGEQAGGDRQGGGEATRKRGKHGEAPGRRGRGAGTDAVLSVEGARCNVRPADSILYLSSRAA